MNKLVQCIWKLLWVYLSTLQAWGFMLSLARSRNGSKASNRVLNEHICRCQTDFNFYVSKQAHQQRCIADWFDNHVSKKPTKPTAQPCSDITDLFFIHFKWEIFFKNSGSGLFISFLPFFLMDLSGELQRQLQRDIPFFLRTRGTLYNFLLNVSASFLLRKTRWPAVDCVSWEWNSHDF